MVVNKEKYRRMELRKATGTRKVNSPEPKPLNRGPEYAMSFACFECRKSFKRHFDTDPCDYPSEINCPECESAAFNLGRNFKPPKKSDLKQWEKVKFLVDHGFVFQKIRVGPGHHDTVSYPETLEEAKKFVVEYKKYAIIK